MKQLQNLFPLLFSTLVLTTACEEEIGELREYESPRLVVNALITAQADSQVVSLRLTGPFEAETPDRAEVSIRRNGLPFCDFVTRGDSPFNLLPSTDFQPGDEVSIDVKSGEHHAFASAVVPTPVLITGVDTLRVQAKRFKWSSNYEPNTRFLVHLRLPESVRPDEVCYFRAEVYKDIFTVSSVSLEGDVVSAVHLKDPDEHNHTQFGYWGDPALTETENADQNNMSVSFDWLEGVENVYHVFRSNYFEQGEYTLRLDLPEPYFYSPQWGWAQDVSIRIYAISRTEYNYLQSLSALKTLDTGTIYDSEPGVTTNVSGGTGIFCIESLTAVSLRDDHHLIQPGDKPSQNNAQ